MALATASGRAAPGRRAPHSSYDAFIAAAAAEDAQDTQDSLYCVYAHQPTPSPPPIALAAHELYSVRAHTPPSWGSWCALKSTVQRARAQLLCPARADLTRADFKSYRGRHTLLFADSYFTSIIGPNGSGKSNSMDAISFVLGVRSAQLRSDKLQDLVYRGRIIREARINADGTTTEGDAAGASNGDTQTTENGDTQSSTQTDNPQTAWVKAVYEDDAEQEKVVRVAEEERLLRPLARPSLEDRVLQLLLV